MENTLKAIRKRHELRKDGNTAIAYGIAKGEGLDTEGMTPKQVWAELEKLGYSAKEAYKALTAGKRGKQIAKAAKIRKDSSRADYGVKGMKWGRHNSVSEAKAALSKVSSNGGFWSRQSELEEDLNDAGFEVLDSNSEYIVVGDNNSDSDTQYRINLHGTENSIVFGDDDIEPIRMPDDDDDYWDEDSEDLSERLEQIREKYEMNSDSVFAPGELDYKIGADIENPVKREESR